jgi:hypothetical protein
MYSLVDIGAGVGQFGRWLLEKASSNKQSHARFPLFESIQNSIRKKNSLRRPAFFIAIGYGSIHPLLK